MTTNLEQRAVDFAAAKHKGQWYGEAPYMYHVLNVVSVADRFRMPEAVKIACYLHDTIEDTPTTFAEIKAEFGEEIAELVYSVTDELGRNRKERNAKTWAKLAKHPKAISVKICDRIANVEDCVKNLNLPLLKMYLGESRGFTQALYPHGGQENPDAWTHYFALIREAQKIF